MNHAVALFWNDYDHIAECLQKNELSACIAEYKLYKVYKKDEFHLHYYYLLTDKGHVVDMSVDYYGDATIFEVYDNLHPKTINSVFGANIMSKLGA